jgi:hypothetical protein
MRKIDELIGIIKGITFDGVINDKEIDYLHSWVDKNRNSIIQQRQVEFIQLVDSVLADHFIDEEKNNLLFERTEDFLKEHKDNLGRLYELKGIILGVVCDNEVNESEINRLEESLKHYVDLSADHESSKNFIAEIDKIIEIGRIAENKKDKLVEILTTRIEKAQLETKIDQLRRKVKDRKNLGIDLISILDNEALITEIHRKAESELRRSFLSYSGSLSGIDVEIIVVSLVLIAILEYDSNYYENVRATYTELYRKYSEQKVEGKIRDILDIYRKPDTPGSRSRIINVALENAIVPQAYLPGFFEFVFDIYKRNFEYNLPRESSELYEDFRFAYEGLRNNIVSDRDDITVNATQKTYKLIASTKRLIAREDDLGDDLDALIKLSIKIAELIDSDYWNKEIKLDNPYLRAGYEGWEKPIKELSQIEQKPRDSSPGFRSRWLPNFFMKDYAIFLVSPEHRVKAQYDYRYLVIEVLNNGERIFRKSPYHIEEIFGGYLIKPTKIEIENPLGELTYRVVCGDEIIYDSKEELYRNYIIFEKEGREIKDNNNFEGFEDSVLICYKDGEAELHNISKKQFYNIGYKTVREGDTLAIGREVFNFSSMLKPDIFGRLHENCFISKTGDDEQLFVYKEVNVLAFEADNSSTNFEILINGRRHSLFDMPYKTIARDSKTKYIIDLNLEKSNFYTVEVNQIVTGGKKNRIFGTSFAYDAELSYEKEPLDNGFFRITVSSGFLENTISIEITVADFEMDLIRFDHDDQAYCYWIPFDLGFYKINDGSWSKATDDLWIDDISLEATMLLFDSQCDELSVYLENNFFAEDTISIRNYGYYKSISIGFLNTYKRNRYIRLEFIADGRTKYVMRCYNSCVMDVERTEILSSEDPKRIMVTPVFHGKNPIFFEMINKNGESVHTSGSLKSGQTETVEGFNSFEEYSLKFSEKTKALMLRRKNPLIYQINKTFYAKQDFVGRLFKIDTIYLDQYIDGRFVRPEFSLNKEYVRITGVLGEGEFAGQLFVRGPKETWIPYQINPIKIEICSDVRRDDTMDVYMDKDGDGLLYYNGSIADLISHKKYHDIYIYTLSMKGGR